MAAICLGVGSKVWGSWPLATRTVVITWSPPIWSLNHFWGGIETET